MFELICQFMTQLTGIILACALVIIAAAYLMRALFVNGRSLKDSLSKAEEVIAKQKEKEEPDFEELSEVMSQIEHLKSAWQAYSKKVVSVEDFALSRSNKPVRMSLKSSRCYFNEESVVELKSDLTAFQEGGNVLTGLGILFTFVGLACGIYLANSGLTAGTASGTLSFESFAELRDSIGQLLGGAGQAFASSIFGILFALVFTVSYKRVYKQIINSIGKITEELDELFPVLGEDRIQFAQIEYAAKNHTLMSKFSADWELQVRSMLTDLMEFQRGQTETITQSIKRIEEGIDLMSQVQAEELGKFIRNATSEFSDKLGQKMTEMTKSFDASSRGIGQSVEALNSVVSGMKNAMQQAADVSVSSVEKLSAQVTEIFSKIEETHKTVLANAEKTELEFAKVGQEIEGVGSRLKSDIEESSKGFGAAVETAGTKFTEDVAAGGKEAGEVFKERVADAGGVFHKSVSSTAALWLEKVGSSVSEIQKSLEMFMQVRNQFEEALAKFRAVGENDARQSHELLGQYSSLLKEMQAASAGLQAQAGNFKVSSEQIAQAMVRLRGDLENLVEQFAGTRNNAVSAVEQANSANTVIAANSDKLLTLLTDGLDQFAESVDKMSKHMTKTLTETDKFLSDAVNNLNQAVTDWVDRQEEIQKAAKDSFSAFVSEQSRLAKELEGMKAKVKAADGSAGEKRGGK
jgi:ABC-type transporter Mla subunit MlaD